MHYYACTNPSKQKGVGFVWVKADPANEHWYVE